MKVQGKQIKSHQIVLFMYCKHVKLLNFIWFQTKAQARDKQMCSKLSPSLLKCFLKFSESRNVDCPYRCINCYYRVNSSYFQWNGLIFINMFKDHEEIHKQIKIHRSIELIRKYNSHIKGNSDILTFFIKLRWNFYFLWNGRLK